MYSVNPVMEPGVLRIAGAGNNRCISVPRTWCSYQLPIPSKIDQFRFTSILRSRRFGCFVISPGLSFI
jgi:hypothetical protein